MQHLVMSVESISLTAQICFLPFQAVCCSDYIHCCPAGTKCDLTHSTCVSVQGNATMTLAVAATELQAAHGKGESEVAIKVASESMQLKPWSQGHKRGRDPPTVLLLM